MDGMNMQDGAVVHRASSIANRALANDVENHTAVHAVTVARLLAEEGRRVILRLHGDEPVVTAQTPASGVPLHAAADIAGEERRRVVDADRGALEQTEAAETRRGIWHDRAASRRDDHVAAVVQEVRRLHVRGAADEV